MALQGQSSNRKYRSAKPIPYQLREHCGVYFEEKLYYHALNLLLSLLSSGTVASGAAFVPAPQHLAVAATFVVHPYMTTRAKTAEIQQVANAALQLLRLTNTLVGPITARFDVAFAFTHFSISRHGGRRLLEKDSKTSNALMDDDTEPLNFDLAQAGSLWSRAEDFWQTVGWAFNCSALHRKRWARWKLWLEFMCDVLEDDWKERLKQFEELNGKSNPKTPSAQLHIFKDSLIFKYISSTSGVSGRYRRIMRAIFADGSSSALNEFREVFHNELKELERDQARPQKRQVDVNIDEDIYGDYLNQDNEDEVDGKTSISVEAEKPSRPKRLRRNTTLPNSGNSFDTEGTEMDGARSDSVTQLDDLQAIRLRQRILHLLSEVSLKLPKDFTTTEELYLLFVEFIRHLSLPTFQLLVSPSILSGFSPNAQTTLCEVLLFRLLESSAPESKERYLSQTKLERCFLPYAASANSVIDNAKVSLLLESLMRLLDADGLIQFSPSLKEAVEKGILARAEQAQTDTKKSQVKQRAEEVGWTWLIESGDRMTYFLDKISAGQGPSSEPTDLDFSNNNAAAE